MSILLKNVLFTGLCLAISPFSLAAVKEYHLDIAEKTVNSTRTNNSTSSNDS